MIVSRRLSRTAILAALGILVLALILIAGLRPIGFDRDSLQYLQMYNNFSNFADADYLTTEPTFLIISYISKTMSIYGFRTLLFIYATIGIILNVVAIKKMTTAPFLALMCFVLLFFPLHTMTQIRVGVACALFLLSIPDLADGKKTGFFLKAGIAVFFHYSALLLFLTYFIDPESLKEKFYLALPIIGLIFSSFHEFLLAKLNVVVSLLPVVFAYKIQMYLTVLQNDDSSAINLFSISYLGMLAVYYFAVLNIKKFNGEFDIILIKLLGWSIFIYYSMSFLPVIAVRVSEIFSVVMIIILPSAALKFKEKSFSMFLTYVFICIVFVNNVFVHSLFNF